MSNPRESNVLNRELPPGPAEQPEVESKLDRIINASGLVALSPDTSIGTISGLLENLTGRLKELTAVDQALLRDRVIKLLKDAGVQRAAAIVDPALRSPAQKNESDAKEVFRPLSRGLNLWAGRGCWTCWSRPSCAT